MNRIVYKAGFALAVISVGMGFFLSGAPRRVSGQGAGRPSPTPTPKPRSTPRRIPQRPSTISEPSATPVTKSTPTPAPTPVTQPTPAPTPLRTNVQLAKGKPDTSPLPLHAFEFDTVTLDADGKVKSRETKTAYKFAEDLGGGVELEMVAIPPGEFTRGTPESESEYAKSQRPLHQVRIDYWYYLGQFEITQSQWRSIMGTNPSHFKECDECPVETVSWNDATEFCRKLSERTGRVYRLPSEAEWEYGARGGTISPYAFGSTIARQFANFDATYVRATEWRGKTFPVGSYRIANGFGLYDTQGNVSEWCEDRWHQNYEGAPDDGRAWLTTAFRTTRTGETVSLVHRRVFRGGDWMSDNFELDSGARDETRDDDKSQGIGLRVLAVARAQ